MVKDENLLLLRNLQEMKYEFFRQETYADMFYGFQVGDAHFWRELSDESMRKLDEENDLAMGGICASLPHCAICMEYFRPVDIVSPLPCYVSHIYHSECIRPWLLMNRNCPLCKHEVDSATDLSHSQDFHLNHSIDQQLERQNNSFTGSQRPGKNNKTPEQEKNNRF